MPRGICNFKLAMNKKQLWGHPQHIFFALMASYSFEKPYINESPLANVYFHPNHTYNVHNIWVVGHKMHMMLSFNKSLNTIPLWCVRHKISLS